MNANSYLLLSLPELPATREYVRPIGTSQIQHGALKVISVSRRGMQGSIRSALAPVPLAGMTIGLCTVATAIQLRHPSQRKSLHAKITRLGGVASARLISACRMSLGSQLSPPKPISVLFVCLGNICRSPAAEAFFRAAVHRRGLADYFQVDSCGTGGGKEDWYRPNRGRSYHEGDPADPRMARAALQRGVELTSISRPLCREDMEHFDLILGMEEGNLNETTKAARFWRAWSPNIKSKLILLPKFCVDKPCSRVPDPWYIGTDEAFDQVLDLVEDACEGLIDYCCDTYSLPHNSAPSHGSGLGGSSSVPRAAASFRKDSQLGTWGQSRCTLLLPRSSSAAMRRSAALGGVADFLTSQGIEIEMSGDASSDTLSGAHWSSTRIIKTSHGDLFVKTSKRPAREMFEGEAKGLEAIGSSQVIRVPKVWHYGDDPVGSFIIMQKLDLGLPLEMREFGRAMARLHLAVPADSEACSGKFGFPVDNTIGGTPQMNTWTSDWPAFFREQRVGFLVARKRLPKLTVLWRQVLARTNGLQSLFSDGPIRPSILHGDLYSGNYGGTADGPAIFDPAAYYGHHEAEWGMAWCADFTEDFWAGYREFIPKAPLFDRRKPLYEAYHMLNHAVLFPDMTSYMDRALENLRRLL